LTVGIATLVLLKKKILLTEKRYLVLFGLLVLASLYAIIKPGKEAPHYLLLLFGPITLLSGFVFGLFHKYSKKTIQLSLVVIFLCLSTISVMIFRAKPIYASYKLMNFNSPISELGKKLLELEKPGDTAAVWGLRIHALAEIGMATGTRESQHFQQLFSDTQQEYYLERFVKDLQTNKPAFFLDTVGPQSWLYRDRSKQAHEVFPIVKEYISQHYQFHSEVEEVRIYRLK
jgi:hypothetical protein